MEGETSDAEAGERMAADKVCEQDVETDSTLGISEEGTTLGDVTIGCGSTWDEDIAGRGTYIRGEVCAGREEVTDAG